MAVPRYESSVVGSIPQIGQPSQASTALYAGLAGAVGDVADASFDEHRRKTLAAAQQQGMLDGVRRAPDGKLTWRPREDDTEAARTYNKAAQVGYLASYKNDMAEHSSQLMRENENDPEAYQAAWAAASAGYLSGAPEQIQADVQLQADYLGRAGHSRLLDRRRELDTKEAQASAELRIDTLVNEMVSLADAGQGDAPDVAARVAELDEQAQGLVDAGIWLPAQRDALMAGLENRMTGASARAHVLQAGDLQGTEARIEAFLKSGDAADWSEDEKLRWASRVRGEFRQREAVRNQGRSERYNSRVTQLYEANRAGGDVWAVVDAAKGDGLTPGQLQGINQLAYGMVAESEAQMQRDNASDLVAQARQGNLTAEEYLDLPADALNSTGRNQVEGALAARGEFLPGSRASVEYQEKQRIAEINTMLQRRFILDDLPTEDQLADILPPEVPETAGLYNNYLGILRSGRGGKIAEQGDELARGWGALRNPEEQLTNDAAGRKAASAVLRDYSRVAEAAGQPGLVGMETVDRTPQDLFRAEGNLPILGDMVSNTGVVAPEIQRGLVNAFEVSQDERLIGNAVSFIARLEPRAADRVIASLGSSVAATYEELKRGMPAPAAREAVAKAVPGSETSRRRVADAIVEDMSSTLYDQGVSVLEDVSRLDYEGHPVVEFFRDIGRVGETVVRLGGEPDETFFKPEMPPVTAAMEAEFWRQYQIADGFLTTTAKGRQARMEYAAKATMQIYGVAPLQADDALSWNPETRVAWVRFPWTRWYGGRDSNDHAGQQLAVAYDSNVRGGTGPTGKELVDSRDLFMVLDPGTERTSTPSFTAFHVVEGVVPVMITDPATGEPLKIYPAYEGSPAEKDDIAAARWARDAVGDKLGGVFTSVVTTLRRATMEEWEDTAVRGRIERLLDGAGEIASSEWEALKSIFNPGQPLTGEVPPEIRADQRRIFALIAEQAPDAEPKVIEPTGQPLRMETIPTLPDLTRDSNVVARAIVEDWERSMLKRGLAHLVQTVDQSELAASVRRALQRGIRPATAEEKRRIGADWLIDFDALFGGDE